MTDEPKTLEQILADARQEVDKTNANRKAREQALETLHEERMDAEMRLARELLPEALRVYARIEDKYLFVAPPGMAVLRREIYVSPANGKWRAELGEYVWEVESVRWASSSDSDWDVLLWVAYEDSISLQGRQSHMTLNEALVLAAKIGDTKTDAMDQAQEYLRAAEERGKKPKPKPVVPCCPLYFPTGALVECLKTECAWYSIGPAACAVVLMPQKSVDIEFD